MFDTPTSQGRLSFSSVFPAVFVSSTLEPNNYYIPGRKREGGESGRRMGSSGCGQNQEVWEMDPLKKVACLMPMVHYNCLQNYRVKKIEFVYFRVQSWLYLGLKGWICWCFRDHLWCSIRLSSAGGKARVVLTVLYSLAWMSFLWV